MPLIATRFILTENYSRGCRSFTYSRDKLGLDPQLAHLLERYYKDFVRAGAKLSDSDKEKLKKINAELATLQTDFEQNVLKERNASSVVVDKKEELAGLTDDQMKRDQRR